MIYWIYRRGDGYDDSENSILLYHPENVDINKLLVDFRKVYQKYPEVEARTAQINKREKIHRDWLKNRKTIKTQITESDVVYSFDEEVFALWLVKYHGFFATSMKKVVTKLVWDE